MYSLSEQTWLAVGVWLVLVAVVLAFNHGARITTCDEASSPSTEGADDQAALEERDVVPSGPERGRFGASDSPWRPDMSRRISLDTLPKLKIEEIERAALHGATVYEFRTKQRIF